MLSTGSRLGPYEILAKLGEGGMGEVYKARDTRLNRSVAVKVLPPELASDPDRRTRFEREAHAIAALSHPHICTVHDIGRDNGTDYLVMELLEGETLADRLGRSKARPLPMQDVLRYATEIADALDKAHRAGIVHRDLKPANIMITKSGAKLLDFGLAKLRGPVVPISMTAIEQATTTGGPKTASGTILGTVHYMSPEQVEGREADARGDIWALGVVIYEMATGSRPFEGDSAASVIGAILKDEAPRLSEQSPLIPDVLDWTVRRCLQKDQELRWHSAADVGHALRWAKEEARSTNVASPPGGSKAAARVAIAVAAVSLIALAAMTQVWLTHRQESAPDVSMFSISLPRGTRYSSPPASIVAPQLALSPDGRALAFVAEKARGRPGVWVRKLDALEAHLLPGTDDAIYPFWSPDSKSIGFFARGKLKTIAIDGGPPKDLADAPLDSRGATWNADNVIVYSPNSYGGLYKVSAAGGPATATTQLDESRQEISHRFPSFLPDGKHYLYATRSKKQEYWGISIGSLDSPMGRPLLERSDWAAQAVEPGYILFVRGTSLMAQRFDTSRLVLDGEPVPIAESIGATTTSYAAFSASKSGVLVYGQAFGLSGQLQWFNRTGIAEETVGPASEYLDFELSPNDQMVAVSQVDPQLATADVWQIDLARGIPSKLTVDRNNDASVLWSPDGTRILFRSNRLGGTDLYDRRANGAAEEQQVLTTGFNMITTDWSRDGRYVLYTNTTPSGFAVWAWPLFGDRKPFAVVQTPLNAMHGRLSPDGKWVAYTSDESGEPQVYVQPFPPTGDKKQISSNGGAEPRWRRDGNELFYLGTDERLMAVPLPEKNAFAAGVPKPLFEVRVPSPANVYRTNYAVTSSGQRFLVDRRVDDDNPISVVLNWQAGLKR